MSKNIGIVVLIYFLISIVDMRFGSDCDFWNRIYFIKENALPMFFCHVFTKSVTYAKIIIMKIHLSNNAYLRNFDSFLRDIDTSDSTHLEITTNDHWIHVHPVVLTLVSALALKVGSDNVTIDVVRARSGHYLEAMGLFELIDKPSPYPSI